MSRYVFTRKKDPELPSAITPELANIQIRICTKGYPETGTLYFEGTVRKFVLERLPHETLIELLPNLLTVHSLTYQPASETILIERIDD